jgi:hypothetical protein
MLKNQKLLRQSSTGDAKVSERTCLHILVQIVARDRFRRPRNLSQSRHFGPLPDSACSRRIAQNNRMTLLSCSNCGRTRRFYICYNSLTANKRTEDVSGGPLASANLNMSWEILIDTVEILLPLARLTNHKTVVLNDLRAPFLWRVA